jgi:hypothetical protein
MSSEFLNDVLECRVSKPMPSRHWNESGKEGVDHFFQARRLDDGFDFFQGVFPFE